MRNCFKLNEEINNEEKKNMDAATSNNISEIINKEINNRDIIILNNMNEVNDTNELANIDPNTISYFTFKDKYLMVKVTDVYDGDTCSIILKYAGTFAKYKLRMFGYDSPERRPRLDVVNRDEIIKNALIARDALKKRILHKVVAVYFYKEDKYGRLLGNIYIDKENINKWMIDNNYGYPYFGGKKRK
jgi:endonuclease YncB( thermonuclease family)